MYSAAERVEILLALALSQKPEPGDCPSVEEIAAWHGRRLSGFRRSEVESHVAQCEHCYGIWSDLLNTEMLSLKPSLQSEPGPVRRRVWSWIRWISERRVSLLGGGLVTACLALLVYLSFIPQREQWPLYEGIEQGYLVFIDSDLSLTVQNKWVWGSGLQIKSPDLNGTVSKWESGQRRKAQRAFQYGVRVGLQRMVGSDGFWRGAVQVLPSSPEACSTELEGDVCETLNRTFLELGRWAVLVHFACDVTSSFRLSSTTNMDLRPDFWKKQANLMVELDKSIQMTLPGSRFSRFFSEWRREAEDPRRPRAALCGREAALLSLGLH